MKKKKSHYKQKTCYIFQKHLVLMITIKIIIKSDITLSYKVSHYTGKYRGYRGASHCIWHLRYKTPK